MSPRDRRFAEFCERCFAAIFVLLLILLAAGTFD